MQIYTIVIGGLEKSYMQKLVLYLNERLGKSCPGGTVGTLENTRATGSLGNEKTISGSAHGG